MFFNKITIVILFTFWLKAIFSQNVFNINIPGANYRNFIITKDSGFITYQAEPPIYNGGTIYKINKYGNILDSIFNPKVETASKAINLLGI